jgi:hypothetical protein
MAAWGLAIVTVRNTRFNESEKMMIMGGHLLDLDTCASVAGLTRSL